MIKKTIYILFFILIALASCTSQKSHFKNGMVVSAKIEASEAGVSILKQGGNAFDAMIATDLALAVVYPNAGNLGGGGFMVFRLSNDSIGSLDYREKSPSKSTKDMYLNENGDEIKGLSTYGGLAVGIPGTVAGLFEIYQKFGSIPLEIIFEPAIDLANNGFLLTEQQAKAWNEKRNEILAINDSLPLFAKKFKAGDRIINKPLANTLKLILKNGKKEFYEGSIAKDLVKYLNKKNGIITLKDLSNYSPVWRDPFQFKYKNIDIISMGPPSSGGIVLGQIFKMIEAFDISKLKHNSSKYIQLLVEAEKRAFADRSEYLGDPDFNYIPANELIDSKYVLNRMNNFSFKESTPSKEISFGDLNYIESQETTHYSIVDQFGNAVSVTTTLNANFGSKLIPPKLGFFLNNEMDDFSIKPGLPNFYGLIGGDINSIEPNKRMLSSMTPTIVKKDNKLHLVLGSPGGPTIITSVLQTILNFEEFNFDIDKSVNSPRFHHLWLPDLIYFEKNTFDHKTEEELLNKGYEINKNPNVIGRVDAIHINKDGFLFGAADKRGDDTSIGY